MKYSTMALACGALTVAAAMQPAAAQSYPSKQVRMIIPAGAGGTVDTIGRIVGQRLGDALGQSVVADNRPGAGTMLGSEITAKSPPDGYTVLMMTNSHAINAGLRKRLAYDPIKDFEPVILVANSPYLVAVHPSVPAKSAAELIALAKRRPGDVRFGSAGTGSGTHLAGELFKLMAKIDMVHVPYKGGSAAQIGLASGEVDLMFTGPIASAALRKSGRIRAIAVTAEKRLPSLPDLPTVAESGLPGYESGSWYGVLLPAGTPGAIVERLNREIAAIMKMPEVRNRIEGLGADATTSTPADFGKLLASDIARWKKLSGELGLKL